MGKTIYITESQERKIVENYLHESLIVNSSQVSDIVNYLNSFYQPQTDFAGDVGMDGLMCPSFSIVYVVNGQPLQQLKREELLDVINDKFRRFIKDDASRLAYYNQIIDDWIKKIVKPTGQLSVNYIDDKAIEKFKNYTPAKRKDDGDDDSKKKDEKKK